MWPMGLLFCLSTTFTWSSTFIFTHLDIYYTLCFYHLVLASIFVTCYILQLEFYYLVLALFQSSWVRKTAAGVDLWQFPDRALHHSRNQWPVVKETGMYITFIYYSFVPCVFNSVESEIYKTEPFFLAFLKDTVWRLPINNKQTVCIFW